MCQYDNLSNVMLRQQSNSSQIQFHNLIPIKFAYVSYSIFHMTDTYEEKPSVSDF